MPEVANLVDEKPGPFLRGRLQACGEENDVFVSGELGEVLNELGVDNTATLHTSARGMLVSHFADKNERIHTGGRRRMFHHQVDCRFESRLKDFSLKNDRYIAVGDPFVLPPVLRERFNGWRTHRANQAAAVALKD